jgi:hypothetical protein
MLELADIVRAYGPAYLARYGDRMLPSHKKVLQDIATCRTAALGGEVFWCDHCRDYTYRYHSCGNRHCPKCGQDRADRWRDRQLHKRLPVPYFLVTFTLPHTLNALARSNQTLVYDLLFRTSAAALQALALNPTWLGGRIGMLGALHTWQRDMGYHLHVHYLVPGGALDPQSGAWLPAHPKFLVPGSALRTVFRAKFRDALQAAAPDRFRQVPSETWHTTWTVHCKAVGDGRTALKYLTPYVYRVALSNRRLLSMKDGQVTFSYKPHKKGWQTMTLPVLQFLSRFLQHVLPKGFQKVRYYGFLHPSTTETFTALKHRLDDAVLDPRDWPVPTEAGRSGWETGTRHSPEHPGPCPHCGQPLRYLGRLPRWRLAPGQLTLPRPPPEHTGQEAS